MFKLGQAVRILIDGVVVARHEFLDGGLTLTVRANPAEEQALGIAPEITISSHLVEPAEPEQAQDRSQ